MSNPKCDIMRDAFFQLTRYGEMANIELVNVLWKLTDINDNLINGRDPSIVARDIAEAKALLDKVPTS